MSVYEYIKNKIIIGELKQGSPFDEKKIAAELNTSRTPIREAVLKLSNEGYLIIIPRKGTIVSTISIEDIQYIYEYRMILEPNAILQLDGKVKKETILYWKKYFNKKVKIEYKFDDYRDDDDKKFHHDIISFFNNPILIDQLDLAMDKCLRIRIQSNLESKERYIASIDEHLQLLELLEDNKLKEASNIMKEHLKNTLKGFNFVRC